MEIISLEYRTLYKSTGTYVREGHEKSRRKRLFLQHQIACGVGPLNMSPNKPIVSKMANATEASRSKRSGI